MFKELGNSIKSVKTYRTIDEARSSLFDYIEFFYNPKRRHDYLCGISPNEFEKKLNVSYSVYISRGVS